MSIKYKCVKNITEGCFFVEFYYGNLEKTEYIIIVCKSAGYTGKNHVIFVCLYRRAAVRDMICCTDKNLRGMEEAQ